MVDVFLRNMSQMLGLHVIFLLNFVLNFVAEPGLLQHFDSKFCTFYLLQVQEFKKVQALVNVQVG